MHRPVAHGSTRAHAGEGATVGPKASIARSQPEQGSPAAASAVDDGPQSAATEAEREPNPVLRFVKILGPGLITGASDDDPSGIGTYAVAGASLGYTMLWTALFTLPMMASIQFICAKVGMVSGRGLAGVLRKHYPQPLLYAAVLGLLIANTINVG